MLIISVRKHRNGNRQSHNKTEKTAYIYILQCSSAVDTQNNCKVAIKKLARPFQSAVHAKRTYRELRLLKHMNHENVIGLLDVFHPGDLAIESFDQVYLVTHLMGADLNNIIRTQRLSDDHVQFLIYQVLRGLKYIHSAGIIHRVSVVLFVIKLYLLQYCFMMNINIMENMRVCTVSTGGTRDRQMQMRLVDRV